MLGALDAIQAGLYPTLRFDIPTPTVILAWQRPSPESERALHTRVRKQPAGGPSIASEEYRRTRSLRPSVQLPSQGKSDTRTLALHMHRIRVPTLCETSDDSNQTPEPQRRSDYISTLDGSRTQWSRRTVTRVVSVSAPCHFLHAAPCYAAIAVGEEWQPSLKSSGVQDERGPTAAVLDRF